MIPLQIDLSSPSATSEQTLLAMVLLGVILVVAIIIGYRARYTRLPAPLNRDKAALSEARASADVRTFRFPGDTDFRAAETRETLRRLFDPDADLDRTTPSDAISEVRRALGEAWAPVVMRLPKPARWLLSLAINVFVFGLFAVSTDVILRVLRAEPRQASDLAQWPVIALTETAKVVDLVGGWLFELPGVALVWQLLFSLFIIFATWLYSHWYVTALLLGVGVAMVTAAYRYADADPGGRRLQLPTARRVVRNEVIATLLIWAMVLVGIGLGRRFGTDYTGVFLGAAAGSVLAILLILGNLALATRWVLEGDSRLRAFWHQSRPEKLLSVVRTGWLGFAAIVAPLLPIYVIITLVKLPSVVGALLSAAPEVQLLALAVIVLVGGALAYAARSAWTDVRTALVETASQQSVRATVVGRGIPLVGVGGAYVIGYGFVRSIVIAASFAILAGLFLRGLYLLALRAKYRTRGGETTNIPAGRVIVQAAVLEDDSGREHYFARVNGGYELLHPTEEGIVDTLTDVGDGLVTTGEATPTIAEWHAKFAFEFGITDIEETEQKLREKTRKRLYNELMNNDRLVATSEVERTLDEYPPEIREARFDREVYLGNIRWSNDYVELRNNPFIP